MSGWIQATMQQNTMKMKTSISENQNQKIAKLNKDKKILHESKEKMELEFENKLDCKEKEIKKFQNQLEWTSEAQEQSIEKLSKELKSLHEDKEKMHFEFNDELRGKEGEKQLLHMQFEKETFKLNEIIGKLRNELQSKETKIRKCLKKLCFTCYC